MFSWNSQLRQHSVSVFVLRARSTTVTIINTAPEKKNPKHTGGICLKYLHPVQLYTQHNPPPSRNFSFIFYGRSGKISPFWILFIISGKNVKRNNIVRDGGLNNIDHRRGFGGGTGGVNIRVKMFEILPKCAILPSIWKNCPEFSRDEPLVSC